MLSRAVRGRVTDAAAAKARAEATEPIWNFVWWRRITYFATLTATLLLLTLPLYVARLPYPPILADGRTWVGGIIRLLTIVLPALASEWVEVYADNPFYFFLLAGVIFLLLKVGTRLERTLRDEARRAWRPATNDEPVPPASWVQTLRTSPRYQRFLQRFKWYVLPDWVVAPLIVVLLLWTGLAVYTQTALPFLENGTRLCKPSPGGVAEIAHVRGDFRTRDVCSESFGRVGEGQRYVVSFDVVEPWYDSRFATTPQGIGVGDFPLGLGYLAAPLRRVIDARYLQPLLEVRPNDHGLFTRNIQIYPLSLGPVGGSETLYQGEFIAPRSGELFLFANDAMVPLLGEWWGTYDYRHFYEASGLGGPLERGNRGSACVRIARGDLVDGPMSTPTPGSTCAQAVARESPRSGGAATR